MTFAPLCVVGMRLSIPCWGTFPKNFDYPSMHTARLSDVSSLGMPWSSSEGQDSEVLLLEDGYQRAQELGVLEEDESLDMSVPSKNENIAAAEQMLLDMEEMSVCDNALNLDDVASSSFISRPPRPSNVEILHLDSFDDSWDNREVTYTGDEFIFLKKATLRQTNLPSLKLGVHDIVDCTKCSGNGRYTLKAKYGLERKNFKAALVQMCRRDDPQISATEWKTYDEMKESDLYKMLPKESCILRLHGLVRDDFIQEPSFNAKLIKFEFDEKVWAYQFRVLYNTRPCKVCNGTGTVSK